MSDEVSESVEAKKLCSKCGGGMVQGFVLDRAYGGAHVASWVRGTPKRSFWQGIKIDGKLPIPIGTFRCSSCDFLESYAERSFAAQ